MDRKSRQARELEKAMRHIIDMCLDRGDEFRLHGLDEQEVVERITARPLMADGNVAVQALIEDGTLDYLEGKGGRLLVAGDKWKERVDEHFETPFSDG